MTISPPSGRGVVSFPVLKPNSISFQGQVQGPAPVGETAIPARPGKNGLWVAVEMEPAKVGGLGEVTKTIPEALNRSLDKDVRVLVPYLRPLKNLPDAPFEKTGVTTRLQGPDGQWETFELMQRVAPGKPTAYAIANERYFGQWDNLYFSQYKQNQEVPGVGKDAIFKSIMLFNRAAAALIPRITQPPQAEAHPTPTAFHLGDALVSLPETLAAGWRQLLGQAPPAPKAETQPLQTFNNGQGLDFIIVHDWHTSPLFQELPEDLLKGVGKLFFLHNTYNEPRPLTVARDENRLKAPPGNGHYSPLEIGIRRADGVMANTYYADRIAQGLMGEGNYVQALQEKLKGNRVFDMHHGLSQDYTPLENPNLKTDGYTEMGKPFSLNGLFPTDASLATLKGFKAQNKTAMQRQFGLAENPNAVIFSWVARPEFYQKGFNLVMNEVRPFLEKNPQAQLVLAGINLEKSGPELRQWVEDLQADPALKGRIQFPGWVNNKSGSRIVAGSDFLMLPSLYEPYGLSQLEAMAMGTIPIVHGVDGLKSTVCDAPLSWINPFIPEQLRAYGRTGLMMLPIPVKQYWKALDKMLRKEPLHATEQQALDKAQRNFSKVMNRALTLPEPQALRIRWNAMRFVKEQHAWDQIAQRYIDPIATAMQSAARRQQPETPPTSQPLGG